MGGGNGSYTYLEAGEVADLDLRYSVLCQAALAAPVLLEQQEREQQAEAGSGGGSGGGAAAALQQQPGQQQQQEQQPIVYVANDWPAALLLLRLQFGVRDAYSGSSGRGSSSSSSRSDRSSFGGLQRLLAQRLGASAAAAYCIHNLAYQGLLSADAFPRLSLPPSALPALCTSDDWRQVLQQLEGGSQQQQAAGAAGAAAGGAAEPAAVAASCSSGQLNQMRSALLTADSIVTVSRGYAAEVQEEGPFSCGMHDILTTRGIRCASGGGLRVWGSVGCGCWG